MFFNKIVWFKLYLILLLILLIHFSYQNVNILFKFIIKFYWMLLFYQIVLPKCYWNVLLIFIIKLFVNAAILGLLSEDTSTRAFLTLNTQYVFMRTLNFVYILCAYWWQSCEQLWQLIFYTETLSQSQCYSWLLIILHN